MKLAFSQFTFGEEIHFKCHLGMSIFSKTPKTPSRSIKQETHNLDSPKIMLWAFEHPVCKQPGLC